VLPPNKKDLIRDLLKGIETGDPSSVAVVNEEKYIQHNPQTLEGSEGLADLFGRLSKMSPSVNVVRVFEDGDFVFAHTEYDFENRNIGFEIFRFENSEAVEHWDNIQKRVGPNSAGHTMVDGAIEAIEHEFTQRNRLVVQSFVEDVLIKNNLEKMNDYINTEHYTEHNPRLCDDISELAIALSDTDAASVSYEKSHRLLAEGNFVLSVCEGFINQDRASFFDLFRLNNGLIVEHWDTTEIIPPRSEWKNNNGKF
jgi:predicted SnoaL-like aldol condensation-catalyzing enzyme